MKFKRYETGAQIDETALQPKRLQISGINRRKMLSGLAGSSIGLLSVNPASAQDGSEWYNAIFNHASTSGHSDGKLGPQKPAQLEDLRTGPVPLRSDEMLARIDRAIIDYRKIIVVGGWQIEGKIKLLRPGDDDPAIPSIRKRLIMSGDIPPEGAGYNEGSFAFDQWLELGVKKFQKRHGLRISGRLDRPTRAQIAVTAEARLQQLILNRQRIVELLEKGQLNRYILVNAASFQLEAVEQFEVQQRHRVIVGKPDRQTPAIDATIKGLNFFPFWHVPDSVANLDLIPRLMREPDYLDKEHIRAAEGYYGPEINTTNIDWRTVDTDVIKFRQDPGPWNALGLVRINMPNKEIVYLHDTPMKELFRRHHRAYSAGCVRVENVFDLVSWIAKYEPVLGETGAVRHIIDQADISQMREKRPAEYDVTLTRPLPVTFTYITAWVEDDGTVAFRPDVYSRDGAIELIGDDDPDAPKPPIMLSP